MNALKAVRIASTPQPSARLHQLSRHFSSNPNLFSMASKIAVVAGVGGGTGGEVAKTFAKHYPVYLLSRNPANTTPLVKEIESLGGKAYGISADVTSSSSLKSAFEEIKKHSGGGDKTAVAAAIYNASAPFKKAPFLELTEEDFVSSLQGTGTGAFLFSQMALPLLLNAVEDKGDETAGDYRPPTLVFTGATASVKGSAQFAGFAPGKWAVRALSQNLAREFGPKGVHVAHAIIDGLIDGPRVRSQAWAKDLSKISPTAIAEAYWHLHSQPRSTFTWEVDIRPFDEKW